MMMRRETLDYGATAAARKAGMTEAMSGELIGGTLNQYFRPAH